MALTEQKMDNPQDLSRKDLKALAKAKRPWYMKKRFWALGVVGALILATAAGGGSKDDSDSNASQPGSVTEQTGDTKATTASTTKADSGRLFPGRVDAQREDKERNIGGNVEISGYTATVSAAKFQQTVSSFEEDGYVVADVSILNRDKKTQRYSLSDWKLQTSSGQVLDPAYVTGIKPALGMGGDLVNGGTVSGKVVFEVGSQTGDFYLIYKPDLFDAARGIWKVTV